MANEKTIKLKVNGAVHAVTADPESKLLSVLRDDLGLTGSHYGCGEGQCGACTVLLDGRPTRSCLVPISAVEAASITTIEGIERSGVLHPVQQAFLDEDAMQCGYCTSGMILAAVALLRRTPHPTEDQIQQGMQGNVCRCGTYRRIIKAVQKASAVSTVVKGGAK